MFYKFSLEMESALVPEKILRIFPYEDILHPLAWSLP